MASFIPGFAFIMFGYDVHQKQVLAEQRNEIAGHSILVKRADYNNLPYKMYKRVRNHMNPIEVYHLLLQSEDEASPKNILNALKEDYVCEILVRLSLLDLCNVSKTCVRLNGIAKTVFERKYKNKTIALKDLKRNGETMTMMQVQYFLNNFGSSITSISLCENIEDGVLSDVVGLLDKQCKNITSLTLDGELMEHFVIDNDMEMFGRLKELCICPGFIPFNRLLLACSQLEKLYISTDNNFVLDLIGVSLPNLIELHLCLFNCSGIEKFLMRHPRIITQIIASINFCLTFVKSNFTLFRTTKLHNSVG